MLIQIPSLLMVGCGYHISNDNLISSIPTISVPYIKGDKDGMLTEAVIKEISSSDCLSYTSGTGALILEGVITGEDTENLGYQYDRHPKSGKRFNRLVPNEQRKEIKVRISLIDSQSQKIAYGPFEIVAGNDYDFVNSDSLTDTSFVNIDQQRESVLFYSLGQLDSNQGASSNSFVPIYKKMAVKIIEGISNLSKNQ